MRTVTVRRGEDGFAGKEGEMAMSGSETTAREPRDIGCSGSEIVETRSIHSYQYMHPEARGRRLKRGDDIPYISCSSIGSSYTFSSLSLSSLSDSLLLYDERRANGSVNSGSARSL